MQNKELEKLFKNFENQKERLKPFLNSLPYSSAILNKEGKILCTNEKWQEFAENTNSNSSNYCKGQNYFITFRETEDGGSDIAEKSAAGIEAVLKGEEEEFSLEYPCHFPENKRWFKMKVTPLGEGALVIHEDITNLKRKQEKLDAIFDSSLDIFYVIAEPTADGEDAVIKDISPGVGEIFGWQNADRAREEIKGRHISEFHPEGMKDRIPEIHRVLDKGEAVTRKSKIIDNKGEEMYVLTSILPFSFGKQKQVISVSVNINELEETRENLKATLNSIGDAVITTDTEGKINRMNPVAEKLTGWPIEQARERPLDEVFQIINSRTREPAKNPVQEVLNSGRKTGLANNTLLIGKAGKEYQIADSAAPIRNQKGDILGVVLVFRDVTDKYRSREKLKESEERLQQILEAIPDLVTMQDSDMNIIYSNWNGVGNLPEDKRNLYTKCYHTYRGYNNICPDCNALEVFKSKKPLQKEVEQPDGSWHQIRMIPIIDEDEEVEYFVEWVRDITDRKQRAEKIKYISCHDELTGLYNRSFMEEKIEQIDLSQKVPLSIISVDFNGLKIVNEGYGHEKGDEVLKRTASLLESCLRPRDILCRWAGDEFIILLPRTDSEQVEKIVDIIQRKCDQTQEENIPLSLGVGYSTYTEPDQNIYEKLYETEDKLSKDKLVKDRSNQNKLVQNMLNTLGAKSYETKAHALRMTKYATKLGKRIGLSQNQLNNLSLLATLHDIGKVNIAEEILKKPSDLTREEWETIKKHTEKGYSIAGAIEEFAPIAESILAHHERWDGDGYPQGLSGEEIPLLARIISIVDAYDVMTNGRPYKEPMSKEEALQELKDCAGSQFDPELVKEFVEMPPLN